MSAIIIGQLFLPLSPQLAEIFHFFRRPIERKKRPSWSGLNKDSLLRLEETLRDRHDRIRSLREVRI